MKAMTIPELNRACQRLYDQLMSEAKAREEAHAQAMKGLRRR